MTNTEMLNRYEVANVAESAQWRRYRAATTDKDRNARLAIWNERVNVVAALREKILARMGEQLPCC